MKKLNSIHIGILRYENVQDSVIAGLVDFFKIANAEAKKVKEQVLPNIEISLINLEKQIDCFDIAFLKTVGQDGNYAAIIVPPDSDGIPKIVNEETYIKFLHCHSRKGTVLASISTGVFLLAKAGLLRDKIVTTHWSFSQKLRENFPHLQLDTSRLLIDEIDVLTASGGISWVYLGFNLVKRYLGPVVMARTSRMVLLQPESPLQTTFCVFNPCNTHEDYDILKVQHWIASVKINNPITLTRLSEISRLTIRTLQRRFMKATGLNVTEYLQRYKIQQSQIFLQYTSMPIFQVAKNVGYRDSSAFAKIFLRFVGLNPETYRQLYTVI